MSRYEDLIKKYTAEENQKDQMAKILKKKVGKCVECGKSFEKSVTVDKNGVTRVGGETVCPQCRKFLNLPKNPKEKTVKEATVKYEPYEWQKKFHSSTARCKVISGAARSGKDRACVMEFTNKFVELLNEDRDHTYVPKVHAWIIAPTYVLVKQLEREVLATFPSNLVINYTRDDHLIETINGGIIEFKSADDPDSLVSVGLDFVWITEAARIKDFQTVVGNIEDRLSSPRQRKKWRGWIFVNK